MAFEDREELKSSCLWTACLGSFKWFKA